MCGSTAISQLVAGTRRAETSARVSRGPAAGVRVGVEVDRPPSRVRDVRVELGRREIRMPEHLLDATQVGASLEQVRREGVAEQVGVDAPGFEAGLLRELAEDQER